jgi:hypothetical protein
VNENIHGNEEATMPVSRLHQRALEPSRGEDDFMGRDRRPPRANAPKLLALAEQHRVKDLDWGDRSRQGAGETPPHCVLLYLTTREYQRFSETLLRHGASRSGQGLVDKEKALMSTIGEAVTPVAKNHRPQLISHRSGRQA